MQATRRRFIAITAAAGGLPLASLRGGPRGARNKFPASRLVGRGAGRRRHDAIRRPDPAAANRLIAASLAEVERLEQVMSLYRPDSALSRLNRDGTVENPPFDLVRVLSESRRLAT